MNFDFGALNMGSELMQKIAPHTIYDHNVVKTRERMLTESAEGPDLLDSSLDSLLGDITATLTESAEPTTESPKPRPAVESKEFVKAAIQAKADAAKHTQAVPAQAKPQLFKADDSVNGKLAAKGDLFKKTITENFMDEDNAALIEAVIKVFDLTVLGK